MTDSKEKGPETLPTDEEPALATIDITLGRIMKTLENMQANDSAPEMQALGYALEGKMRKVLDSWQEVRIRERIEITQIQNFDDAINGLNDIVNNFYDLNNAIANLRPYIEKELHKPENQLTDSLREYFGAAPDATGIDFNDFSALSFTVGFDSPEDVKQFYNRVIDAARKAKERGDRHREGAQKAKAAPKTTAKHTNTVDYPLDKINSKVWNLLEEDTKGQITFDLSKSGSKKPLLAYYAIDFDKLDKELEQKGSDIVKRLTPFDKRVYVATSAVYGAGNEYTTLTQLYSVMGFTGKPNPKQLDKISGSLTKMAKAWIYIDNKEEAKAYKQRTYYNYDGALLPMERVSCYVNGVFTDAAVHIFREPPLMTFARERKQITTVPVYLLQSPLSKTDSNYLLEDYLLERISRERNKDGVFSCRILFSTLYENTGITTIKQRQRATEKIKKLLDYYVKKQFITRYAIQKTGITVYWEK